MLLVDARPQPVAVSSPPPARVAPAPTKRALWVLCEGSQRVLEHPDRVALLLADAEALGVSDLFVQVYRGGRAWFRSTLADATPWQATTRPDGSDGLAALIEAAHARGLRVHAWVNVLNLAGNRAAPILGALGRDAAIVDQKGRSVLDYPELDVPPPDREWLRMGTPAIWLDAAVPGVAERLAATFAELVRGYPLDGLHFDYVRYPDTLPFSPGTQFGVGLGFGFGEPARARFQAETGLAAPFAGSLANAERFDAWRRARLTALVAGVAAAARAERPGLRVSAAVIPERERAYRVDLQDWLGWLDAGHLDFAVPMLYTRDPALLRYGVETYAGLAQRKREIWVGLGSWLFATEPARAVEQLRVASGTPGLATALFSWDSIRETPELLSALATDVARVRTAQAR